jgi:hypothetical protein
VVSHRSPPDPWGWGGPGAIRATLVNAQGQPENLDAVKETSGVQTRQPGWLDIGRAKNADSTWPWGSSAIAFDGARSVVVWQRHRLIGEKFTEFENSDLLASRVDGFAPVDVEGVPVAASSSDEETAPALAGAGNGRLMLAYQRGSAVRARVLLTGAEK